MGYMTGRAVWAILMLAWWLFTAVDTGALSDGDVARLLGQTVTIGVIWLLVDIPLRLAQRRKAAMKSDIGGITPSSPMLGSPWVREYKGPLAFFRRHFNGDYSLARSYWVNTFLVALFAPVLGLMLLPWLSANFPARYGSAGFLFITALGVVVWVWAVSGTWASANKHAQRGGSSRWALAAKGMIVLGVINTLANVINMTPALVEHARVAAGAQPGGTTRLEIRADGRSILLSGGINDGSAEQLDRALEMAPSVTTVVLASEGGWIREGKKLAEVIGKRGLNTYIEQYCVSACTIAFLAGKSRAAAPSAKLGFHASRSVGSMGSDPDESATIASMYRSAGLPEYFVRKVRDTPYEKIWFPTQEELLAAGVLTRRSTGGETAAMATVMRSKEALAAELKKD